MIKLFENDTKDVLKMISRDSMKVHSGQNLILFITFFLTTAMLMGVITTGFSFYQAEKRYSDLSAGPGAEGFAIMGLSKQEKQIRQYPDVKWAALVREASFKRLENPEIINCDVRLLVTDQVFYDNNYISLKEGTFPKEQRDIMISDTLADRLHYNDPVGKTVSFTVTVREAGQEIKKAIDFDICGLYENPLAPLASEYEEIYTSDEFINVCNTEISDKPGYIYVRFNNIKNNNEIYERLKKINDEVGGVGVICRMQEADNKGTAILMVFAVIIIMLAAYFIIFNVFSISLAKNIRYYGMMKTIGATTKQIRYTLDRQVYVLLFPALALGLFGGYVCGRWVAPVMTGLMDGLKNFYEPSPILLPSFAAALFVIITVKTGCRQSFLKVSQISPVEAARFVFHKRQGRIIASFSLMLCCIIFCSAFTFFFGYDVEDKVREHNIYDFKLMNDLYLLGSKREAFEPVSEELCTSLSKLSFVKDTEVVYAAYSFPDSYKDELGNNYFLRARVKNTGILAEDFKRATEKGLTYSFENTGEDLRIPICGVSTATVMRTMENENFRVLDGEIDLKLFESGKYVLYQPFGRSGEPMEVHAEDEMDLQIYDKESGKYRIKKLKVMAVVMLDDNYGRSQFSELGVCISDKVFKELYPDYSNMIASVGLDTDNSKDVKNQQEEIKALMSRYQCYQLSFTSKYDSMLYFKKERNIFFIMGMFFTVFFSVIGITNILNSAVNDVLSNQIAYARMQAVGMTKRQLFRELVLNNFITYGLAFLVFIPLEFIILGFTMPDFSAKMLLISVLIAVSAVFILLAVTSLIMVKYLNRESIACRLRVIE